jgi:hypothetical protein
VMCVRPSGKSEYLLPIGYVANFLIPPPFILLNLATQTIMLQMQNLLHSHHGSRNKSSGQRRITLELVQAGWRITHRPWHQIGISALVCLI